MLTELIDNIYQHSEFNFAAFMAQRYESKNFVEITIIDNGISIPHSFKKFGLKFDNDNEAITYAIRGKSTKREDRGRGYGLPDTTNLYINGCGAEFLIVSREGAWYKNIERENIYTTKDLYRYDGTIITLRIKYPIKEVNMYEYIS